MQHVVFSGAQVFATAPIIKEIHSWTGAKTLIEPVVLLHLDKIRTHSPCPPRDVLPLALKRPVIAIKDLTLLHAIWKQHPTNRLALRNQALVQPLVHRGFVLEGKAVLAIDEHRSFGVDLATHARQRNCQLLEIVWVSACRSCTTRNEVACIEAAADPVGKVWNRSVLEDHVSDLGGETQQWRICGIRSGAGNVVTHLLSGPPRACETYMASSVFDFFQLTRPLVRVYRCLRVSGARGLRVEPASLAALALLAVLRCVLLRSVGAMLSCTKNWWCEE
jgi:hypothetical protein